MEVESLGWEDIGSPIYLTDPQSNTGSITANIVPVLM